ncbi:5'-nucleotidase signature 2 [Lucifera butyrica]|uniref:5'-nucleotidase signature 2 n=1 Tax=Lucifera butyrica TaxID=1351585 RepID=A0A498R8V7_9FIRM|nr:5'-nucleotidase C-terminal domain-containing protein [Lucifera butyrica]VBB07377.1 5'-nucleotidase signature 2 [Lucifera butyrica]
MNCLWRGFARCTLAVLLFAVMTTAPVWAAGSADVVSFEVLTVNDFHGALPENGKNPGAAKLAQYLKETKAVNPAGTIIVSAGDMFQGTPDSNLLYGKTVVDVMNQIGFDAMTVGNHEFDWGVDILKKRINQSAFPYVAANIIDKKTGKPADFVKPYILLSRQGVKIAVIGLATPETAYKASPKYVAAYTFADPVQTVNQLLPELQRQGAEIILVVSHLASYMDRQTGEISGDAAVLARETRGLTAVISGHSHQTVYGKVNGVPVVQAYYNGRAVGKVEILYDKAAHKVVNTSVETVALPYPGLAADPAVARIVQKAQAEIGPVKNVVLGKTLTPLDHSREEPVVSPLGQWATDVLRTRAKADVAFQNGGGLRTGLPAGEITMGMIYEVMPFDNTIYTADMTGKQIKQVLEYGIMNTRVGMLQFSGVNVVYDPGRPAGDRVVSVTLPDGSPLGMNQVYRVATNDFMAAGGDGYIMFKEGKNLADTFLPVRDALVDAIKAARVIQFHSDGRLKILAAGLASAA